MFVLLCTIGNGNMESRVNAENDEVAVELMNLTLNDGVSGEPSVQKFSFDELIAATDNFRSSSVLGQGGFGTVYKGYLPKQKVCKKKNQNCKF